MIFTNESAFNRFWSQELEVAGAVVLPIVGSEMGMNGWPDRYVAHRKWSGWIEGKIDKGTASDLQIHRIKQLLQRGIPALILHLSRQDQVVRAFVPQDEIVELGWLHFDQCRSQVLLLFLIECTRIMKEKGILWQSS